MRRKILTLTMPLFLLYSFAIAQIGSPALVEVFTETGCSSCSQYDSAFNAMTNSLGDKVAVISYHCFYQEDHFYKYTKAGDQRYSLYGISQGYPAAILNGKKPSGSSTHISYATKEKILSASGKLSPFKVEIVTTATGKGNIHSANIEVRATEITSAPVHDLRVFVVVTENNINYKQRYKTAAVNGIVKFDHIARAILPDASGAKISVSTVGNISKVNVSFTNNDKEINPDEVRIVAFVQDMTTNEILGTAITKATPFK